MARVLLAILITCAAPSAFGCSCLQPPDVAQELERSASVVDATVVALEDRKSGWQSIKLWFQRLLGQSAPSVPDNRLAVRLRVHEVWKGKAAPELVVYTARDSAACGFPFEVGRRYFIYSNRTADEAYAVSLCSRTRLREEGEEGATLDRLAESKTF